MNASRLEMRGENISNRENWCSLTPRKFPNIFHIENYLLPRLASSNFDALTSSHAPISCVRAYIYACLIDPVAWINTSSIFTNDLWRKSKTRTFPSHLLFRKKHYRFRRGRHLKSLRTHFYPVLHLYMHLYSPSPFLFLSPSSLPFSLFFLYKLITI